MSIPAFSETSDKVYRAKSLMQAKQIGLALKLFAGDNDGDYPNDGVPDRLQQTGHVQRRLRRVVPELYLSSETIFGDELSAYQTRKPDNVIDQTYTGKPGRTLEPGENVYGYMMGLTDYSNPAAPLVFDGTDGTGYYTSDAKARGGVGGGVEAIVIRLDNSGVIEPLAGPPNLRFVPLGKVLAEKLDGQARRQPARRQALRARRAVRLDPAIDPQVKP